MKRSIKRCVSAISFLAVFGWLFVHISYSLRGTLAHTQNNLSGYYDLEKDSLDVVVVGTSGTFTAYSPMDAWEKYGFASYDFCTNGMGADTMANAVHEALKTQSPKVLVIDTYGFIVSQDLKKLDEAAVRYNTDGYRYSLDRLKLILEKLPEKYDAVPYLFDIIKYHTNTFSWKNFFAAYHNVEKGYNATTWAVASPAVLTDERVKLKDDFDGYLDELLRECNRADVENILFTYFPYGDIDGMAIGNPNAENVPDIEMVNYIRDRVEAAGYPFLNCVEMRDQFGLDYQRDYWYGGHFSVYAAEKIADVFGAYLKDNYDLPDRRDDPVYAAWNEDVYSHHQYIAKAKASVDKLIEEANAG